MYTISTRGNNAPNLHYLAKIGTWRFRTTMQPVKMGAPRNAQLPPPPHQRTLMFGSKLSPACTSSARKASPPPQAEEDADQQHRPLLKTPPMRKSPNCRRCSKSAASRVEVLGGNGPPLPLGNSQSRSSRSQISCSR